MFRRSIAFTAALALAAPFALADDAQECTPDAAEQRAVTIAPRLDLAAFFARVEQQITETENGVSAPMGPTEVVVVRIGTDGKPVLACVDTEEAARRFFDAPVEKLPTRKAQEQ